MPFPDATFDALWSIWVLEHIPNPERALAEMRRIMKPGGVMFLMPAFEVSRFAGRGYEVRPYAELSLIGKAAKAIIPVIRSAAARYLYYHQVRALRSIGARIGSGPPALHFIRLSSDYEHYWQADADATTSVSPTSCICGSPLAATSA